MQRGDLYRLRPPTGGLSAVQYVHGDEVVVLAWLQAQQYGEPPARSGCADSTRQKRTSAVKRAKCIGVPCCCITDCGRGCAVTSMRRLSACVALE